MSDRKRLSRFALVFTLLITLCAGTFSPRAEQSVAAKPNQLQATNVVISEFRFRGDGGATDEFIELYNPTSNSIDISGWELRASNNSGGGTTPPRIIIPASTTLFSGQYYLIANNDYSGPTAANLTYGTGISDDGGIALTLSGGATIIDQVGLSSGSAYVEGTFLPNLGTTPASNIDRGYERKLGGTSDSCQDDNNNTSDFQLVNPSNPQNSSTPRRLCGVNADLRLSISAAPPSPAVLGNAVFTITLTNDGVSTATNVTVRTTLPAGLNYSSNDGGAVHNSGLVTWTIPSLNSGSNVVLNITTVVNTSGIKTVTSEVWASDQVDPDSFPGNLSLSEDDYATVSVTPPLTGVADVGVTKTVNTATPNVGDNIVFTVTVRNYGTDTATSLVIQDSLPAGLTYVSHSASVGTYNSGTGAWSIVSLAANTNATLQITSDVTSVGVKTNTATVTSLGQVDSNALNDTASVTVTPSGGIADLILTQAVPTKSISVTGQVTFSITVTNNGPYTATNVVVKDDLPTGFTYVTDNSGGTYNKTTGLWVAGDINSGVSKTLTITARVDKTGVLTNVAEVWSVSQTDPNSIPGNSNPAENDYASVNVSAVDLRLTQTSSIAGSNAVFTITVTNTGTITATNVNVSNSELHLPASYTFVSNAASPGTSYNSGTGIWNIPSLASGATVTLVVTTTIVSLDENLAQISTTNEVDIDSIPGNSSGTEDDEATTPSADLSLVQSIFSPAPYVNPEIDTNVTFRITVLNAGNANATSVKVKSILPTGLTYVSHTSGQIYDKDTGFWSVGSLARNTSISLDIVAKVTVYGTRTNFAEISFADQSDPDSEPGNGPTNEDDNFSVSILSQRAVIINEIAWAGTASSAEDEWIELYNPSDTSITLSGWTIRKDSCLGPIYITLENAKTISRDGYFLLERGNTSTDNTTVSDVPANQIYLITVPALLNTGETLYLCDSAGNSVDTANKEGFGSSTNPWPAGEASSPFGSMERQGNTTEKDDIWVTNRGGTRNGSNSTGGIIYGTPGRKNSTGNVNIPATPFPTAFPTATPVWIGPPVVIDPRPIINEILARPGFDWNQDGAIDVFDEFIEVKNLTAINISLSGWRLDKFTSSGEPIESFPIPADVTLKPGEHYVFYSKQTNLLLSDGGETVRLVNPSGKIYDAYTYDIARLEDKSFCRLPDGTPGNSWFFDCIPTPNLTNTREGKSPTSPDDVTSPFCNLPDTIPLEFFIPECNGYGADIWNPFYWDFANWIDKLWIQQTAEKWRTFIE